MQLQDVVIELQGIRVIFYPVKWLKIGCQYYLLCFVFYQSVLMQDCAITTQNDI